MTTTIALQDKTDLQLILTYQKNKKNYKAQEILLDRYKEITYSYALKTWKKVKGDLCIEVEDLLQDYKEQCLRCFEKINAKKIKNEKTFNTIGIILNRYNAYYKVIKKRYHYGYYKVDIHSNASSFINKMFNLDCLEDIDIADPNNSVNVYYEDYNRWKHWTEPEYILQMYIKDFHKKIDNKVEKNLFEYLILGFKGYEIANKLNLSDSTICNMKKKLKQKFVDYMELK